MSTKRSENKIIKPIVEITIKEVSLSRGKLVLDPPVKFQICTDKMTDFPYLYCESDTNIAPAGVNLSYDCFLCVDCEQCNKDDECIKESGYIDIKDVFKYLTGQAEKHLKYLWETFIKNGSLKTKTTFTYVKKK